MCLSFSCRFSRPLAPTPTHSRPLPPTPSHSGSLLHVLMHEFQLPFPHIWPLWYLESNQGGSLNGGSDQLIEATSTLVKLNSWNWCSCYWFYYWIVTTSTRRMMCLHDGQPVCHRQPTAWLRIQSYYPIPISWNNWHMNKDEAQKFLYLHEFHDKMEGRWMHGVLHFEHEQEFNELLRIFFRKIRGFCHSPVDIRASAQT